VRFQAIAPDVLAAELAASLPPQAVRVALDGPPCAQPHHLAAALLAALGGRRPGAHVRAEDFWRDASLRLEYGREDVQSYLNWLDTPALRREVLDSFGEHRRYLPSLRDPQTNRSTRVAPVTLGEGAVLVVSGPLLLGQGLPFDRTIHLAVSQAARARRTPPEQAWTLPAFDQYDAEVDPAGLAEVVIRYDDPRHPAIRV
jgi:hypothetical protein